MGRFGYSGSGIFGMSQPEFPSSRLETRFSLPRRKGVAELRFAILCDETQLEQLIRNFKIRGQAQSLLSFA